MTDGGLGEPVLRAVHEELLAHGLRRTSPYGRYARARPDGADLYYLVVEESSGHVTVAPDVAVRHELVEGIFHRFSGSSPQAQPTTPTIGGRLAETTGDERYSAEIHADDTAEELHKAVRDLRASVTEAERYWERYADLHEVDHALNDHPAEPTPHRPLPWLRCATGVIVARLVGRPDYERVVRVHHGQMRLWSDGFYLPRFEALVAYLAGRTPEQLLAESQDRR
jgi:hypothetical protein